MPRNLVMLEYRGPIALLTLNRPEKHNAFNRDVWAALEDAIARLKEKTPRVAVITGAGERAFSAGFDVSPDNPQVAEMAAAMQGHDHRKADDLVRYIRGVIDRLVSLPVPLIAAINGLAYGGGAELAVRCDLRVMDLSAVVSFSEARLGLMPDWGGGVALARLVGTSAAADLVLTGRRVGAYEALALGLVNRVSLPGKAREESLALAGEIAMNGPRAVRAALAVIRRMPDMPLAQALDMESDAAAELIASGECVHGITAFLSRKDPEFPDIE
jgi:enoyl-CoA hydratase/carnithine racemase